jgi:hypothetical protein
MQRLKTPWVRIVISLFAGGIINELIFISTGDPNRPRSGADSALMFVYGAVIYFVLTAVVNKRWEK